ncbi:MAG: flagellar hook basal-body protein [Pseudomonadota bacterium]
MPIEGVGVTVSALAVLQRRRDATASNLANASTSGYSPRRVDQADLAGGGVQAVATTLLGGGPLVASERGLDLALDGAGFFAFADDRGGQVYSRSGKLQVGPDGRLTDLLGRELLPALTIPLETATVNVAPQGAVEALASDGRVLAQGQIEVAAFANPGGLQAIGGNAFVPSPASGPPVLAAPGEAGRGLVVAGATQASGTDLVREMVDLTLQQHEFSANLRTLSTQDEMVGAILDVLG